MRALRDALRTAYTFGVGFPVTMGYATLIWLIASFRPRSRRLDPLTRSWGRMCLRLAGSELEVSGLENLDVERSYVVISNHLSGFDIMAHFAALPIPIRFLAKTELFKIPMFGKAMRAIGIVEINRGAGRSIHDHINTTAKDAVAKGRSLIIYPEGTRPHDGQIQSFKKGAFTIATSMQLPVLPIATTGSYDVWRPGKWLIHAGPIHIKVMPAIETDSMEVTDADDLRQRVHAQIEQAVLSTEY